MHVEATTSGPLATDADTVVVGVFQGEGVAHDVADGTLAALLESGEADGKFKRVAVTHTDGRRFIVLGLGERPEFDAERARVAAALAHRRARELSTRTLCWEVPHHVDERVVAALVEGTLLHAYRFERYKRPPERAEVGRLLISAHHDVSEAVRVATIVGSAQNRARDLGNMPANDLSPAALSSYAEGMADRAGLRIEILDEQAIRDAGMGAFAAVAQGSSQGARLIQLHYGEARQPDLALVGKAVTFDSGGLSLKPARSMAEMKFDMSGGAAVIETLAALAELHAPVSVLGVVGATENMPGGSAVKPGDIVRALDGTTIEINNTDAEGRLVLADCIAHAIAHGGERLLDIATLTGGIVTALGSTYAGMMSNDDGWAAQIEAAARATGELVWRMPLHSDYAEMVKGRYAQLTNHTDRREATPITGAELLHHFADGKAWAHVDIAGTAYDVRRPYYADKGATGFGVRLLVELARRLGAAAD